MSVLIITSNALYHSIVIKIFEVIFECQEQLSAVWNACLLLAQICLMGRGMDADLSSTYRSRYWLRYGYLGTLNVSNQWLIDFTLQNRVHSVFITEFVERLPTIFPSGQRAIQCRCRTRIWGKMGISWCFGRHWWMPYSSQSTTEKPWTVCQS